MSTYLHLLVCLLEFNAMEELFGNAIARRTLEGWEHYTWVYREVLDKPEPIRDILRTGRSPVNMPSNKRVKADAPTARSLRAAVRPHNHHHE